MTQFAFQENSFDLWHDRAVFHFLTDHDDRERYLQNLKRSLKPNGYLILATFAEDGPLKCSGLDVERYSLEKMKVTLGAEFELVKGFREEHTTPFRTIQNFQYGCFRLLK